MLILINSQVMALYQYNTTHGQSIRTKSYLQYKNYGIWLFMK